MDYWCAVKLKLGKSSHVIAVLYNPPLMIVFRVPNIDLITLLQLLRDHDKHFVICGNFNVPNRHWDSLSSPLSDDMDFCDSLFEQNLKQLVDMPTHSSGNILDLLITSNKFVSVQTISPVLFSDHFSIVFSIYTASPIKRHSSFSARQTFSTSLRNYPNLQYDLSTNIFSLVYFEYWDACLFSILKPFVPLKRNIRNILPSFYSSHSVHLFNKCSTALRRYI